MDNDFIRLGSRTIIKELELFFLSIISKFSFDSFFESNNSLYGNLGLFIFAKGHPTLYIFVSKKGPFMIGLTTERHNTKAPAVKQVISVPEDFSQFYRNLFIQLKSAPPNIQEAKMHICLYKKAIPLSSFAIFGKKEETLKLLKEENVLGIKKISVASLFTEEKVRYILNSYERWNEQNYRFDFYDDKVFFSIKSKKSNKNSETENRAVAAMVKNVISESYSNLFENEDTSEIIKGIPMILTTFQIRFSKFPRWIGKVTMFLDRFYQSIDEVDKVLDEIVFPQMKFLK